VPFWWWTGDPLDPERLTWQLEQLHQKGISGVQVNYAHEDTPGWPTYPADPPIFSESWWRIWGRVADECRKRGMGIGLSTYTLDWTGAPNLFRQLFYSKPELHALRLLPPTRQRLKSGQTATIIVPENFIGARAYRVRDNVLQPGGVDLMPFLSNGVIQWTAPDGEWEVCAFQAERQPNTLNPLLAGVGEIVIRDFYQRFQDATPNRSPEGLNYFFNDELHIGAGTHVWNSDFAAEFKQRKGYDLFEVLPALWGDLGPLTPKARMDYADVRMTLMEERYFQPIYLWHASRGLIFACDSGGRGLQPDEFGDYFRVTRWYTAPGHDTPGGKADLIKGKVSSSIASLYRRPRVWLEGYHSFGWGATPERLMFATRENFLYGCTLLNLHGLYYTTHGSYWEWAPPCYHFRMPYWDHMGVFLKYFDRLSYLLSQGTLVCDVAVLYPVAPFEAGLDGPKATQVAFDTARALMTAGINFEFIDADSLARATVRDDRLEVSDSSYRVLIFPAMEAVRWSSLEKAAAFAKAGGRVLSVGGLPLASDRAGRDDKQLDALATSTFRDTQRLAKPADAPPQILAAFTPDTQGEKTVRSLHRKIGPRHVYMVMDAPKNSVVEFRAKGRVELWDPWTGETRPLRVVAETQTGTKVEMPLEDYEAQIIVFSPGQPVPASNSQISNLKSVMPLDGEWEFELKPTMDNRYGDFRLPVNDKIIGPEARIFRHAVETADTVSPQAANFDDSRWERVTYDFGPQFWLLGPLPAQAPEADLAKLTALNPQEPVSISGKQYRWRSYSFSWRLGLEGDPGHQGWHGLKENISDHFLCLGKRGEAFNETKYEPEPEGGIYYLWTSATIAHETQARIIASTPREGPKPHASEILTPAAVYLNGSPIADLGQPVTLRAGSNPILVRYDRAGRGYFVLKRDGVASEPPRRTPLAMTWFDDSAVLPFDLYAGAQHPEWFRFVVPPGFRAMTVTAKSRVETWADGRKMRDAGMGRFEAAEPLTRASVVALRVAPATGARGAGIFPEPIRLDCGPGITTLGDWSKVGALECYSGGAWYRKTFSLTPEQASRDITLDLGKLVATAEVRVNGQLAGIRVAPPWRVDISKQIKAGENRIEVLVYNTLANHYVTIPTRYHGEITSGLVGPVTLEFTAPQKLSIETSNKKLETAFQWAIDKALSYVQTGKTGVVDRHERDRSGTGMVTYIPSYWAGYTWRTAFYSRDFCHQAAGAHLLGLQQENLSMLRAFAATANADRKWYPLWALNFDGTPFKLDYAGDHSFVREVPAVFELVEQCHRQYLWTGNPAYAHDPVLWNFCTKAVTDFIALHDTRIPNGVAEGDGSGDIFRGSATYNEIRSPLVEAGDAIASQYQAMLAYSRLLNVRAESQQAIDFEKRALALKTFFNTQWGVKQNTVPYVRGYDVQGRVLTDFGLENSWFMPMKFITEPSPKTDAYLDFIAQSVASPQGKPSNLEAISYLPGVFFPYNRVEEAWKWLEYIIDQPDREYPEISYTLIGYIVEGLLGVEPNAPQGAFLTVSRLPDAIPHAGVRNVPLGDHRIDVLHHGTAESTAVHTSGVGPLKWDACFYGNHSTLVVNGKERAATPRRIHGVQASSVTVELLPGQSATVVASP